MNIGVVSDSHGDTQSLRALVEKMGKLDALCFLGDISDDARYLEDWLALRSERIAFYAVRGNNDFDSHDPEEIVLTLKGHRILMVHGHRHGVKQGLLRLSFYAQQKGTDVVLFGHTHMAHAERDGDLLMLNPGAAGRGFFASQPPRGAVLCLEADGCVKVREVQLLS